MSKLAQTIQNFIALVDTYVDSGTRYARAEKTVCGMAIKGKGAHALDAAIPDYLAQFKAAREKVLTAVPALAQALEQAGVDSRDLLRLHNAVAGRGGSAAIRKLWPKLKAELQRAGIQGKIEPAGTEKAKRATVAARMIDLVKNTATHEWTAREFAAKLGCYPSSIVKTGAWIALSTKREEARQERSERAYRKNRGVHK